MLQDSRSHLLARGLPLGIIPCLAKRMVAFQRKLCVDGNRARRVWQSDKAIDPAVIAYLHLEPIGVRRQDRLDQIIELDFPKSAARLLVGENVLQANNLARQLGDVLLRRINDSQALLQFGETGLRLGAGFLQTLVNLSGDIRQTLV